MISFRKRRANRFSHAEGSGATLLYRIYGPKPIQRISVPSCSNLTVPQRNREFCAVKVGSVHTDKDYHEALCTSFRLPRLPNSTFPIFHGRSRIQVITGITIAVGEGEIKIMLL